MEPIHLPVVVERIKAYKNRTLNEQEMAFETSMEFDWFLEAVWFVADLAEVAEVLNHHPVIVIDNAVVVLSVTTNSWAEWEENTITEDDFKLIEAIDRLVV